MYKYIKNKYFLIGLGLFVVLIFVVLFGKLNIFDDSDKIVLNEDRQNNISNSSSDENLTASEDFDSGENSDITEEEKKLIESNKKEFTEFGDFWIQIDTDDLKLKAPIVDGVTPDKLALGVGRHKTTALPDEEAGNMVLSGHRWLYGDKPSYKVFEDLDKLNIGDKVKVHYEGKDYTYKITERKVVKDDDVSILDQTDDRTLTLYTCTPKYTALKRLVYIAKATE